MEIDFKKELEVRSVEAQNRKLELEMQRERQEAEIREKSRLADLMFKILEKQLEK